MGVHLRRKAENSSAAGISIESRVVETTDALTVVFADKNHPTVGRPFDFTIFFKTRSTVARAFAYAFLDISIGVKPHVRQKTFRRIYLFLAFLEALDFTFSIDVQTLDQIDNQVDVRFHQWLKGTLKLRGAPVDRGEYAPTTISQIYNTVRRAVDALMLSPEFTAEMSGTIRFKKNPESDVHKKVKSRQGLTEAQIIAIRTACISEIDETLEALRFGDECVASFDNKIDLPSSSAKIFSNLSACVGAFGIAEQQRLSRQQFARRFPGLDRATRPPYHTMVQVRRFLHFTPRTLIPFILLLNFESLFNPDTQLTIESKDIELPTAFSSTRKQVMGAKNRPTPKPQFHTYADTDKYPYGTNALLAAVMKHTARTRRIMGSTEKSRRLFVFANEVFGFGAFESQNTSTMWRNNLMRFIADHRLKHFTLAQIRATGSDLISEISRGDIAAQKEKLNHASARTTVQHYESSTAKKRRKEERLAPEIALRDRRLASHGKADTRGQNLSAAQKTAVTPGFLCFDPENSPIAGQVWGRLCSAYGMCPNCPLASVNVKSPTSLFRILQFKGRLEEASISCSSQRWLRVWQPQLTAVESWLRGFDPFIFEMAAKVDLPPTPRID